MSSYDTIIRKGSNSGDNGGGDWGLADALLAYLSSALNNPQGPSVGDKNPLDPNNDPGVGDSETDSRAGIQNEPQQQGANKGPGGVESTVAAFIKALESLKDLYDKAKDAEKEKYKEAMKATLKAGCATVCEAGPGAREKFNVFMIALASPKNHSEVVYKCAQFAAIKGSPEHCGKACADLVDSL